MSIIKFPENPTDGMLFELAPGILYRYNKGSHCWRRLRGSEVLSLATPLASGLMSKEDFSKLDRLIVPPPQATLKGEECSTAFKSGLIGLYSSDDSINIKKNLRLTNRLSQGSVEQSEPWNLHENTAGFDFGVALTQLIEETESRNQLKKVQLQGDTGPKGVRGDPGEDRLDTGPVGIDGIVGVNSPFDGTTSPESIPFEISDQTTNKAIVGVSTEEISEDENFLVLTRANIGNPDACPSLVIPKDFQSFLLTAINTISGGKLVRNQTISSGDCSLICRICASSIHHVNIEPILIEIFEKFKDRVNRLKISKEELVRAWLRTMVSLFNEQKSALCCALENCQSRKRNERTRQYIETQKVQAAQGNFGLAIDGIEDRKTLDLDHYKDCPIPVSNVANVITTENGVTFILDSKIHIVDPRTGNQAQSVTAYLPPGTYQVEITGCCAQVGSYSGRSAILYKAVKSIGSGSELRQSVESNVIAFPDLGVFSTETAAKNAYQGLSLTLEHAGGNISAWILDPDGLTVNNDGFVTLTVTDVLSLITDVSVPPSSSVINTFRDEVDLSNFLGSVAPFSGGLTAEENLDFILATPPAGFDIKDKASFFLYSGPDGVSLFFIAGAVPGPTNDQLANILLNIEINNNPFAMSVLAADAEANVKQLSPTRFTATVVLNEDNSGFVIGPIDTDSDYSITISDSNLSTIVTLVMADSGSDDITLAEGTSEGIGGPIAVNAVLNTAPLSDVTGIDEEFGGGNERGLGIDNEVSGQNVVVTRPLTLGIATTYIDLTPEVPITGVPPITPTAPSDPPIVIAPPDPPVPTGGPPPFFTDTPTDSPPPDEPTIELKGAEIDQIGGTPSVGLAASSLPRGTTGSPQDPCVVSVNLTINTTTSQSLRYVMTDSDGFKYYSAFVPTDLAFNGAFQFLDLGPPISAVAPPEEFTPAIINSKTLDLTLVEDKLTPQQLSTADSLQGIARLTFVQSIIGTAVNKVADGRSMVDFEIEFHKMPAGPVLFGAIVALVGVPGALTEVVIDDFSITTPPASLADPLFFTGIVKRILADVSGGVWSGLGNYFQSGVGDNFYSTARSITQGRVTQISTEREYQSLNTATAAIVAPSGSFTGEDVILVDDSGGVIVADVAAGQIFEVVSSTGSGATDVGNNQKIIAANGLRNFGDPVMEFGAPDSSGAPVIIASIGSQWYRFGAPVSGGVVRGIQPLETLAVGPAGNSLAADRDVTSNTGNNFTTLFSLETNKIFKVDPTTGAREVVINLPEAGFGLKIHPVTKDFYYITDDLGTSPRSGTRIKRVIPPGPGLAVTHVDTDFKNVDWEFTVFTEGPGGAGTALRVTAGGNPSDFRQTTHVHSPATIANKSHIRSFHIQKNADYLPSVRGPILRADFAVDANLLAAFSGSDGFASGLALKQGGNLYATSGGFSTPDRNWTGKVQLGSTASEFGLVGATGLPDFSQNPDFTTSGALILFGYFQATTHTNSLTDTRRVGFDNWSVTLTSNTGNPGFAGVFAAPDGDALYSITFGHTVPESSDRALYALLRISGENSLVEIGIPVPPTPGSPLANAVPTNSAWTSTVTGGQQPLGNPNTWIFTRIPPGGGCQMHYKQVQWYERGWRIGACCGALVQFGGTFYIVVKRSIGADTTCGGGESATTPCIAQFVDSGVGHPAIAWPTTPPEDSSPGGGGEEFLGLPNSGFVNFMKDDALSTSLLSIIQAGTAKRIIGDPAQEIPFILFPSS